MAEWQPIETVPQDFMTVLTIHEEDLYPVPAYRLPEGCWHRETEGPEDIIVNGSGRHEELYRQPTHWMPLPDPPEVPRG